MNLKILEEIKAFLSTNKELKPQIGIILGTGLGNLAKEIEEEYSWSYAEIPNFPLSTVESHQGKLIYGTLSGKTVLAFQGRFHYYEGFDFQAITLPVFLLKSLEVESLIISNAAGCLNLNWKKGDLMLLNDHINLQCGNPLLGRNNDSLGLRFPDMSTPYCQKLNDLALSTSKDLDIALRQGIYAAVQGPMLETKAEYRFLKTIGADAVGMSTVPEVIAANYLKLDCMAISVLTDECNPDDLKPVALADILAVAAKAEKKLGELIKQMIFDL